MCPLMLMQLTECLGDFSTGHQSLYHLILKDPLNSETKHEQSTGKAVIVNQCYRSLWEI